MPVDNELNPVEVDVDNDVIELFADDNPVDADVDNEVTVLLVVDRPVDSELTPL
ncbi:tash protein pest motif family [Burkholderia pseudomallei]|nr:tash protein pest motif family [Burkholderia pseudomallei]OMS49471.1 tash protein pest motif family [Burkholderia pseudomallei]OMT52263.1 tash protein pest motif family [Burkholderia pseudomallei]OMT69563.1 tash protein pest motif family [Burkholderia pseudomallei]